LEFYRYRWQLRRTWCGVCGDRQAGTRKESQLRYLDKKGRKDEEVKDEPLSANDPSQLGLVLGVDGRAGGLDGGDLLVHDLLVLAFGDSVSLDEEGSKKIGRGREKKASQQDSLKRKRGEERRRGGKEREWT
jgi:hypothetical protein